MIASTEPFYTQFDYSQFEIGDGDVVIEVLPADRLHSLAAPGVAAAHFTRAVASGGRMEIDVVLGNQGMLTYPWILPMRSQSSKVHDGLLSLVGRVKEGKMSEMEEIRHVQSLADERDLLEVH